ncbi:MAG: hypothetical protein GTN98_14740 [Woeseiaceae bacterium]|nr:hypothetical protein [Woeseiaceae bacterium]
MLFLWGYFNANHQKLIGLSQVARVLHAGLMIYANPDLAAVYVASALD